MQLPNNKQIKDVLEGMVGRDVALETSAKQMAPIDAVGGFVATFIDDEQKLCALLGWSVEAAAYVGGCLGLVPPKMTKEMATDKYLRSDIVENITEVSNVISTALNKPGNPHVRMAQTYFPTSTAPDDITKHLFAHSARLDVDVNVSGYGAGQLTIVGYGY